MLGNGAAEEVRGDRRPKSVGKKGSVRAHLPFNARRLGIRGPRYCQPPTVADIEV